MARKIADPIWDNSEFFSSECDSGLGSASDSGRGKSDNSDKSDKDGSSSENEKTPEEMENIKRLQSLVRKSEIVVAQPTYQQELINNTYLLMSHLCW